MDIDELINMLTVLKSNDIKYVFLDEISFFDNIIIEECPKFLENCVVLTKPSSCLHN